MVSTTNDTFFDGIIKEIERSSWSQQCSAAARAVLRGQGLHDAIVSDTDSTRATHLILIKNLRSVEEPLGTPIVDGTHVGFTPLMTAIVAGNADIVRLLIAHGASTAAICPADRNNSVLHYACAARAVDSLALILMSVQRHRLLFQNDAGSTPLHTAATSGFVDVVEILLHHFSSLHAKDMLVRRQMVHSDHVPDEDMLTRDALAAADNEGKTCAHILVAHARDDQPFLQCIQAVLSAMHHFGLQALTDKWGRTVLFYANTARVVKELEAHLPQELPRDNDQLTAVHFAAGNSSSEALIALVHALVSQYKIPASELFAMRSRNGDTVLHIAVRRCQGANMQALLGELADDPIDENHILFSHNDAGESIFHIAAEASAGSCLTAVRDFITRAGVCDAAVREKLVAEALAQRNCMDFSPVLVAATNDADAALHELIQIATLLGAQSDRAASESHWVRRKTTALHLSCLSGAARSVKVFLDAMAGAPGDDIRSLLSQSDDDGNTCLMAAVHSGSLEVVNLLLSGTVADVISPLAQCQLALRQTNKGGSSLTELVAAQCGQRRAVSSLPSSPVKLLSAQSFASTVDWDAVDASVASFGREHVCACDRRKPCIAKAMQSLIMSKCAASQLEADPLDLPDTQ